MNADGDDIPGIGQYEDFHTIDWQRDIARDRMRHRYIVKKVQDSVWDFLKVSISNDLKENRSFLRISSLVFFFFSCFRNFIHYIYIYLHRFRVPMMRGLDGFVYY